MLLILYNIIPIKNKFNNSLLRIINVVIEYNPKAKYHKTLSSFISRLLFSAEIL